MKRKICFVLVVFIILGLSAYYTWDYLQPDSSTYAGFVRALRQNGYIVKDITKQYARDRSIEIPDNIIGLDVSGERVGVRIENSETIEHYLMIEIPHLNNPPMEAEGVPHLYNKGYLVVTYFGVDKGLLKTLEKVLGKSLVKPYWEA